MIVLDTNVVSQAMSSSPSQTVLTWLNEQESELLYLTTITLAEIGYGLRILPAGRRRNLLEERFSEFVARGFSQRILSFDEAAASFYAELMGHRKELGRPMSVPDAQIAAIARSKDFAVATRNIRDFAHCGLILIDPFLPSGG